MWSIFIFAADPSFADDMINGFSKSGHMLISGKHDVNSIAAIYLLLRREFANEMEKNNITKYHPELTVYCPKSYKLYLEAKG